MRASLPDCLLLLAVVASTIAACCSVPTTSSDVLSLSSIPSIDTPIGPFIASDPTNRSLSFKVYATVNLCDQTSPPPSNMSQACPFYGNVNFFARTNTQNAKASAMAWSCLGAAGKARGTAQPPGNWFYENGSTAVSNFPVIAASPECQPFCGVSAVQLSVQCDRDGSSALSPSLTTPLTISASGVAHLRFTSSQVCRAIGPPLPPPTPSPPPATPSPDAGTSYFTISEYDPDGGLCAGEVARRNSWPTNRCVYIPYLGQSLIVRCPANGTADALIEATIWWSSASCSGDASTVNYIKNGQCHMGQVVWLWQWQCTDAPETLPPTSPAPVVPQTMSHDSPASEGRPSLGECGATINGQFLSLAPVPPSVLLNVSVPQALDKQLGGPPPYPATIDVVVDPCGLTNYYPVNQTTCEVAKWGAQGNVNVFTRGSNSGGGTCLAAYGEWRLPTPIYTVVDVALPLQRQALRTSIVDMTYGLAPPITLVVGCGTTPQLTLHSWARNNDSSYNFTLTVLTSLACLPPPAPPTPTPAPTPPPTPVPADKILAVKYKRCLTTPCQWGCQTFNYPSGHCVNMGDGTALNPGPWSARWTCAGDTVLEEGYFGFGCSGSGQSKTHQLGKCSIPLQRGAVMWECGYVDRNATALF